MISKVVFLPPTLAFILLAIFLFNPPIRPIPALIALAVVGTGAWMQFGSDRYSVMWVTGLILHIVFSIVMIFKGHLRKH